MKSSFISRVATVSGLVLGAFALSALAGTWTAPTAPAPGGNPDAPVNVGLTEQHKLGWLGVKGLVTTDFTLATGTPVAGQVLTAIDSLGNARWQNPPVGGGAGGGSYVKAWVSWSRATGILASQGVASVTLDAGGHPIVNLSSPMSSVNYGVVCNATISQAAEEQVFAYGKTVSSFYAQAAHAAGEDPINLMDCSIFDTASAVAGGSVGRSVLKFNARYTTLMSDPAFFAWIGQSAWPTNGGDSHGWYVRTSVSVPRFTDTANKLCSYFMTNGVATLYSGQYSANDYGSDNNNVAHYWDSVSGTWKTEAHGDNGSIDLNMILCVGEGVLDRGIKFISL